MIIPIRAQRVVLSLGSGLALAFAFPEYKLPLLGWVSVAGLIAAVLGAGLVEAAFCGFVYGAAFYTLSVPWVYTVLRQYGPLPVWQAVGMMALLVVAASFFCAFFTAAMAWIGRRSASLALFAAPFLWVTTEFGRTHVPDIGFPWNLLGYPASESLALLQVTSLTGIYGLSFLVAAYNAALVALLRSLNRWPWNRAALLSFGALTTALVFVVVWGGRFVPAAHPTEVAHLVQTNLPQSTTYSVDWDVIHARDLEEISQVTIDAGNKQPGLMVWPEVPAPFSMQHVAFAQRVANIAREAQSYFLLGGVDWKPATDGRLAPHNSAVLLDPQGRQVFLYDKMHLVPFSEYVPWRRFLWFAKDLTALIGEFQHGTGYLVGELPGGPFSVFICYEAVFPDGVRRFVLGGAALLINISNDGWFGRSAAPAQHLAMARVRAVENRRWLLRGTNNGFTVSVDPYGRIAARMAPDIRGALDAPYGFRNDLTAYTRWGDWIAELSAIVSALLLAWASVWRKPLHATRRRRKGF